MGIGRRMQTADRKTASGAVYTSGRSESSKEETMANPVVVIPGFYGSKLAAAANGEIVWLTLLGLGTADITLRSLRLDPDNPNRVAPVGIFDELPILPFLSVGIYKNLIQFVQSNLQLPCFPFFYDWRKSLDEAADLLAKQLSRLRSQGAGEVDLVTHSLGGLVARACLEKHGGRGDLPAVRWLVTLGTPHKGMLKTFQALTTGLPVFTFPAAGVRDMARGFPSAYELLPSDASHPLFFVRGDGGISSGASAFEVTGWCATDSMVSFLRQAGGTLSSLLPDQLSVKVCCVYGTGVDTVTGGTFDGSRVAFSSSARGDGTVPETSARGDGLTGSADLFRLAVPFGEHQGLVSHEKVQQKILTDLLLGRPFPDPLLLSGFASEPLYVPRSPNPFVARLQRPNGDPVSGARVRLTIDGTTVRNRLVPETSPGVYELRVILTQTGARLPYFVTADADGLPAPKPDMGFLFATAS
jgi:pimeloyl-ACP methyl ester carboxylesterase